MAEREDGAPQASDEAGPFAALRRTIQDLEISLQNVLTFASVFVIPLLAYVFGVPLVVALSIGLSIIVWFFVIKSLMYVRSKLPIALIGIVSTVLLVGCGLGIWALMRSHMTPAPPPLPATGTASANGECNGANTGNGGKVDVNCGETPSRQEKK